MKLSFLRRRWLLVLFLAFVALNVITVGIIVLRRNQMMREADQRLAEAVALADAEDPRWRWDDILEDRADVPDEENGAVCVTKTAELFADKEHWTKAPSVKLSETVPNESLSRRSRDGLRKDLEKVQEALSEARRLADLPRGRYPVKWNKFLLSTLMPHIGQALSVADMLMHDAYLRAEDREFDGALRSSRAAVNVGRSIGDEPGLFSFVVRSACVAKGIRAAERALAQGECSKTDLASLQLLVEDELEQPLLHAALRGERIVMLQVLNDATDGRAPLRGVSEGQSPPKAAGLWDRFSHWLYIDARIRNNQAQLLEWTTQLVQISRDSPQRQRAEFSELHENIEAYRGDPSRALAALTMIEYQKAIAMHHTRLAELGCSATALAAERYRLDEGNWPDSLDKLVPRYLKRVPDDPFGEGPLFSRRLPDGFIVYSLAPVPRTDNGFLVHDLESPVVGFRLWNPDNRRQPPREAANDPVR